MTARPLRILLVGDYADDARLGSGKVAHKLRDELIAAGHECTALFADDIGGAPSGRQVRQLVSPLLAARAIRAALARVPYDVIDAASAEGLWFGLEKRLGGWRAIAYVCRSNGIEHLNYRRMLDDSTAGLADKPLVRRLWYPVSRLTQVAAAARLADRLIVLNDTDRRFALERGWQPAARIDVVPHGVSERFLHPPSSAAPRGAGALFCGAWDRVKGVPYLVQAFDRLAADGRPVPLTILGPGLGAADVMQSIPDRLRPAVTVIERVSEERVIEEYRRHDVLVFPSTYEGFGLVVLEAMSQGLPVVATAVGCATDLIRDGENGVIVPSRDANALAIAIRRVMDAPAKRDRIGANAAATVASMTWRRTAERTVDVYRAALADASSSRRT
ncbi:MAG TPA: glycosyltransferase family 4 protein [Gemmatimonadaceae bacterium]|nr:glycosyltransferase family 4 protein [Gemmatimonadaceae bacterium]